MAPRPNRRLIAMPNILRNQTTPNTLSSMRADPAATARPARRPFPAGFALLLVGIAVAVLLILLDRLS